MEIGKYVYVFNYGIQRMEIVADTKKEAYSYMSLNEQKNAVFIERKKNK